MSELVLVIVAHSDDEVLGAGGAIAHHVAKGDRVIVAHATVSARSNVVGDFDFNVAEERTAQARAAAAVLGFEWCAHGTFRQVKMDSQPQVEINWWVESLMKHNPNIVYTHHWGDLNLDHQVLSRAVLTACRPKPESNIRSLRTFEVLSSTEWSFDSTREFRPDLFIDITKYMDKKIEAMECYESETREAPHPRSASVIRAKAVVRGSQIGVNYAEAFQTVWSKEIS